MTKNRGRVASYLVFFSVIGVMMLLLSYITLYSDDYQYAAFFRGGFSSFLNKTVNHYRNDNGRALVHFFAEVFLLCGTKLYAVVFPFLLAAAFSLGTTLKFGEKCSFSPVVTAAALAVFLALPVEYLKETLCWVSGSFNYCFPFLLVMLYFTFASREGWRSAILAVLFGLLSGATTEQSGLAALVGGCLLALLATLRGGKEKRLSAQAWLPIPFVLLGYLTVLLAPGTANRLAASEGSGLYVLRHPTVFLHRLETVMTYFAGGNGVVASARWLILLLMILLGFLPLLLRRKRLRPLVAILPATVLYLLFLFLDWALGAHLVVLFSLFFSGVWLLTDSDFSFDGILLLAGLASLGVMVFTELGAYRTVVPLLLFLITVLVRLAAVYLARCPFLIKAASTCGVFLLCAVLAFPTLRGYRANAALVRENEAAIRAGRETGTIILGTDFDDRYRHLLMFDGAYFFHHFRILYEIPEGTSVYLEGVHYAHYPVFLASEELSAHSVMTGGVLYLPLVELFRAMGGECVWDFEGQNGYYLSYGGEPYYLSRLDGTIRHRETGAVVVTDVTTVGILDKDYIDALAAATFFGLSCDFDGQSLTLAVER